ncbi:sulfatase-like hydrolase/transferase [Marinovum sp.]|uniref:sulfatase-like hydrolase/transferase n=1 Tax=Marinovum sp. TaxID=2024839 RepID=UPI002B26C970|nr:sulfatase-like hydrolase/transferase [Marinovum sp.]
MSRPNILFIFSDQHAQKVSGCYGDAVVQTPNIDRLAREGVRFDNAYCPSPICVPSRMSMLTARWPYRQECWANDDILRSDLPSWPHAAGAAGYDPVLIGRMHAIGPDQLHGYRERQIGDHSPNYPGAARQSLGALAGTNDPNPESIAKSGPGNSAYQSKDRDVTDAAVRWLHDTGAARAAAGDPFCLTVGYMLPHPPYVADPEAYALYKGRVPEPRLGADAADGWHDWWRSAREIDEVPQGDRDRARAAYWALVHRLDEMIGEVLAALEAIGELDNTLIVYASDHGDHLGERGLWWKHTFFEESVKVPLIMRLPGQVPAGETREQVVNLVDLSQTMIEVMGGAPLPHADGRSFWAVAQDGTAPWTNETFSEYCTDAVPAWTGGRAVQQRMIRRENWKLSLYDGEPPLLFDLATDPDELVNRAEDPACAAIRSELEAALTADWSVEAVAARMRARRAEKDLLASWSAQVQPGSSHIWNFTPGINRLETCSQEE